jgi:PAS domain S-box-containing protein
LKVVTLRNSLFRFLKETFRNTFPKGVSEKINLRKALLYSESNFQLLLESSHSGILIYQQDTIIYANPAMETISGYTAGEMKILPLNFWDFINPETNITTQKLEVNNNLRRYEIEMITKRGEIKWFYVFEKTIFYHDHPSNICILVILRRNSNSRAD